MMQGRTEYDPKGLIWEAFRIEGITPAECRTIFLDWALSLEARVPAEAIPLLLARHAGDADTHPMKDVLREGLSAQPSSRRRGGRAARITD